MGGLQIQDEKGRKNSNEFLHVLLEKWRNLWIKYHVALTLSFHLQHVQNEENVIAFLSYDWFKVL